MSLLFKLFPVQMFNVKSCHLMLTVPEDQNYVLIYFERNDRQDNVTAYPQEITLPLPIKQNS